MYSRDYRDLLGGGLLIALGLFVALHSIANFDIGTVSRMGPGMFPATLGFALAFIGVIVFLPALFRPGSFPTPDIKALGWILLAVFVFGVMVVPFGMMPAVAASTVISMGSGERFRPLEVALVTVALCVLAYLIFRVGLGIVLEPFRWPF